VCFHPPPFTLLYSPSPSPLPPSQVKDIIDELSDGLDFYDSFSARRDLASEPIEDSEVLDDTFRDLLVFKTPPVADPCIYSATISSLSHNRLSREASALLKSYSARGTVAVWCGVVHCRIVMCCVVWSCIE
jgi:hypothetical protein